MRGIPLRRAAGALLHPTALPGPFGIGDLGPGLERFLDWAAAAGQRVWQLLPLGPTTGQGSPYSCLSTFAGNPLLLSPERLAEDGLLAPEDLEGYPSLPGDRVDFPAVAAAKERLHRRAWERFQSRAPQELRRDAEVFLDGPAQRPWLQDWTLLCALGDRFEGRPWQDWPGPLARREPAALTAARRELESETAYHGFLQFLFFRQWDRVREEAHRRGLQVMGDLPLYLTAGSAEVWTAPHLFDLDPAGRPRHVAGVPPDSFSATGQLWGNPLYRWERMEEDGFAWWVARLRAAFRLCDLLRLDHFRAFESHWQVAAGEATALNGRWAPGPGRTLFDAVAERLGPLPLVAEDLGVVTDQVRRLRDDLGLPGMRVLQFAFAGAGCEHQPWRYPRGCVVYTGTHDNDTVRGWFAHAGAEERQRALDYLGTDGSALHWDLMRAAYTSVAALAVVPLQDMLGLGSEARFNTPGRAEGNWTWRLREGQMDPGLAGRLRRLAEVTGRLGE